MIFLLLGVNNLILIQSKSLDLNINNKFENKLDSNVIYITASSPYEYGLKAGFQYRLQYKILYFFVEVLKIDNNNLKIIEKQIDTIKQKYPNFYNELQGLSDSTGIKIKNLISLQILFNRLFGGDCTVTASTGPATRDNETYLTENYDNNFEKIGILKFNLLKILMTPIVRSYTWLWNRVVNIARTGPNQYDYAFFGLPVIGETTLINEKGLGYGGTGTHLTDNKTRYIDEGPGILIYLLNRVAMRLCKNVSEVGKLFKNSERAADKNKGGYHDYDYDTSIWCDINGNILVIEQSHSFIKLVYGNSTEVTGAPEGILWHTNHHIWLDANKTGSIYPGEDDVKKSSFVRAARARELLELNYGKITLEICKNITRDHKKGSKENEKDSWDICRHPDKNEFTLTYFSWIIVPKKMTAYWTYGSPCNRKFIEKDFSKIF